MDQRHAGESRAPLDPFSYEQALGDQLAVLNELDIPRAHVIGARIGSTYALKLLDEAPARVGSAVLVEPVGLDPTNSMDVFYDLFNETIRVARAEGLEAVIAAAQQNPRFSDNNAAGPWGQRLHDDPRFAKALLSLGREGYIALVIDFRDGIWPWRQRFFSVDEAAVPRIDSRLLVLPGDTPFCPAAVAGAICANAPNARCLDGAWHSKANLPATIEAIRQFLLEDDQAP